MPESFTCSHCRKTFEKLWTDEEARQEYAQNFPAMSKEPKAQVCDDCYREIMAWAEIAFSEPKYG
jgi:hypothetical protein